MARRTALSGKILTRTDQQPVCWKEMIDDSAAAIIFFMPLELIPYTDMHHFISSCFLLVAQLAICRSFDL